MTAQQPPGESPESSDLREVFLTEARELISGMAIRLGKLATRLDEGRALEEVAARGHTLHGSAALAELPALSTAGAVIERAAQMAASHAQSNHEAARSLVQSALNGLGSAQLMVELARAGDLETQEVLLNQLLNAFPADLRDELTRAREEEEEQEEDVPTSEPWNHEAALDDLFDIEPLSFIDDLSEPIGALDVEVENVGPEDVQSGSDDSSAEPTTSAFEPPLDEELRTAFDLGTSRSETEANEAGGSSEADDADDEFNPDDLEEALDDEGSALDPELAESLAQIFREELKELLAGVPDMLAGLVDPAEQLNICADLARVFHTVKGSAGTVGLTQLEKLGATLHESFERLGEDPSLLPLGPELADETRAPLEQLFLEAGLEPPVHALDVLRGVASASMVDEEPAADSETAPADEPPPAAIPEPLPVIEPEIMEAFRLDADAALEASEQALIDLERSPNDKAPLRSLFRQFHTLKGAAAAVGLSRLADQLHAGETVLERAIELVTYDSQSLVLLILDLLDSIHGLLDEMRGIPHHHRILTDVDARVAQLVTREDGSEASATPELSAGVASEETRTPEADVPRPETSAATPLDPDSAIVRVHASRLDLLMNRVSELVVSRTRMDDAMNVVLETRDKLNFGRLRLNETIESFRGFEFGSAGPASSESSSSSSTPDDFTDLEFDKYDDFNVLTRTLVELAADAGEMLEQLSGVIEGLAEEGRQISKVTSSLQRTVGTMRLLSLDTLFRRLKRSVRDAARQAGKQVEVECLGGEVQLDRGLIESLYGPLLHVVRNAVSHGIERREDRQAAAKPLAGRIRIEAVQGQGSVEIAVRDDGRGLDFSAIRNKAEKLGLLSPTDAVSRDQLSAMIFLPGFSTQERVTDLAGRGVGMDVVASDVERLRGTIALESQDGAGTTLRMLLPLASMIDQVLVLRAGERCYALSQGSVESVVWFEPQQVERSEQGLHLRVGEDMVPALSLANLAQEESTPSTALVLRRGEARIALLVDRIEAQREAVVRPLGRLFAGHPFVTSATFGGDGQVIFVLDAARLPGLAGRLAAEAPWPPVQDQATAEARGESVPTVLWADDSISVRKLAGLFLNAEGWTADTAVDGVDALEKLRQGKYQILVTDLEMPRMHGYELLQEIRSDPVLHDLPVIVCSSRTSEKHRRRAREAGASGYLTKPFTQEALAGALRECLAFEQAPLAEARSA